VLLQVIEQCANFIAFYERTTAANSAKDRCDPRPTKQQQLSHRSGNALRWQDVSRDQRHSRAAILGQRFENPRVPMRQAHRR